MSGRGNAPPGVGKAIRRLAVTRLRGCTRTVNNVDTSSVRAERQHHIQEFQQQAVALLSDAVEAIDETNDIDDILRLTEAADTFLEAMQDLLVRYDAHSSADALGEAREQLDAAQMLLREVSR